MARSKKEAVAIKILAAAKALESTILTLENILKEKSAEEIRENPELFRMQRQLENHRVELENIAKLFGTLKNKQGTRLILARCEGHLKSKYSEEGAILEECNYKIRASMATLMRGVPNCPDAMCTRKGKPFTVEIADEEIDVRVEDSFKEAMTKAEKTLEKAEREKQERLVQGDPFEFNADDEAWLKGDKK